MTSINKFVNASGGKFLLLGLIAIYVIRLIVNQMMGLMPQDAYYYFYSEHLALSYFDHPPMVAYMLKAFSLVFGKSVAAVKLTDFIVTLFSFIGFYYLSSFFLSKNRTIRSLILYGSTLLVTVISINTTPDVPLIFFWTMSLIITYKAVFENKIGYWILAGIFMGLSFDSKYTAVFLLFGLFTFLVFSKNHRHFLFSKEFLLTLVFFAITISPIFIWNIENDWMSFKFQGAERASSISKFQIVPKYFFGNLATQLMLLLPVLFVAMLFVFFKLGKRIKKSRKVPDDKTLFLLSFSLPIILFFFAISTFYWVKLNWIMPAYITAIVLVARYVSYKMLRYQVVLALIFHTLLFVQIVFYPVNVKSDDTWFGWEELSVEVEKINQQYPDNFIFSNDGYKTSAVLNFYLDKEVYSGNVIGANGLQFSVVHDDLTMLKGKNAIFIDSDRRFKNLDKSIEAPDKLENYFEEIHQLDPIIITNNKGKALRKYLVYECINYK